MGSEMCIRDRPDSGPDLDSLRLTSLTPTNTKVRTSLPVTFQGDDSWYLLQRLKEGQRYEVRVCWAATVCAPIVLLSWSATWVGLR